MKKLMIVGVILAAVFMVSCGSQETAVEDQAEPLVIDDQQVAGETNYEEIFKQMRREVERGEGGEFVIVLKSDAEEVTTFTTEYGYVDQRIFELEDTSKLTFFANAPESGNWPYLRLITPLESTSVEEYIGETLEAKSLLFKTEEQKDEPMTKGDATVTIENIIDGMMKGTFEGTLEDGRSISGSFTARINKLEE
jgi:hypothetical protein